MIIIIDNADNVTIDSYLGKGPETENYLVCNEDVRSKIPSTIGDRGVTPRLLDDGDYSSREGDTVEGET